MLKYRFGVLFYEKFLVKFLLSYRPSTCTSLKLIKVHHSITKQFSETVALIDGVNSSQLGEGH